MNTILANLVIEERDYDTEKGETKWMLALVVNGTSHDLLAVRTPVGRDEGFFIAERAA